MWGLVSIFFQIAAAEPSIALLVVNLALNSGLAGALTFISVRVHDTRKRVIAVQKYLIQKHEDPDGSMVPPGLF